MFADSSSSNPSVWVVVERLPLDLFHRCDRLRLAVNGTTSRMFVLYKRRRSEHTHGQILTSQSDSYSYRKAWSHRLRPVAFRKEVMTLRHLSTLANNSGWLTEHILPFRLPFVTKIPIGNRLASINGYEPVELLGQHQVRDFSLLFPLWPPGSSKILLIISLFWNWELMMMLLFSAWLFLFFHQDALH